MGIPFVFTCCYYRKAYYRSFAMSPPACAVGAARPGKYNGERKLLIFQNLHRYVTYFALLFLVFLWHDFIKSLSFQGHFHLGVGSLVILANCTFLTLYNVSCHSFRHLIGGSVNSYSEAPLGMLRYKVWTAISKLNMSHMAFPWVSLFRRGALRLLRSLGFSVPVAPVYAPPSRRARWACRSG